nr:MAG TPA: hypothetical protein [Caudoviricetes sp.]
MITSTRLVHVLITATYSQSGQMQARAYRTASALRQTRGRNQRRNRGNT